MKCSKKEEKKISAELFRFLLTFSKCIIENEIKTFSIKIKDQITTIHINTSLRRGWGKARTETEPLHLFTCNVKSILVMQSSTLCMAVPLHAVYTKQQSTFLS